MCTNDSLLSRYKSLSLARRMATPLSLELWWGGLKRNCADSRAGYTGWHANKSADEWIWNCSVGGWVKRIRLCTSGWPTSARELSCWYFCQTQPTKCIYYVLSNYYYCQQSSIGRVDEPHSDGWMGGCASVLMGGRSHESVNRRTCKALSWLVWTWVYQIHDVFVGMYICLCTNLV